MGVDEIIEEITGRSTSLSGEKLEALAKNLAASTNNDESAKLKVEIRRGFYGEK